MYHHVKKLMYTVRVDEPDPALRQHAAGAVRRRQRRARRRDAVFDPGAQLRGSGPQGPADGHRHRGAEPPGDRRHSGAHASQADEVRPRGGRSRSADRHCRRRRRQPVQLAGQCLDRRLPQDHRRARRRSAQQHRRRGARQDRLRAADQFLRRRRHQGRAAVPDDARDHAHEGVRAALESMGKPAFTIGRIAPTPGLVDQFFNDSTGAGDHGEIDARGPWNEGDGWVFTEFPAHSGRTGRRPLPSSRKARRRPTRQG